MMDAQNKDACAYIALQKICVVCFLLNVFGFIFIIFTRTQHALPHPNEQSLFSIFDSLSMIDLSIWLCCASIVFTASSTCSNETSNKSNFRT